MFYEYHGDLEFSDIENSFIVERLAFSTSGDVATLQMRRPKGPKKCTPFNATVDLSALTPRGNLLSLQYQLFPDTPTWLVRIEIQRKKTKFFQAIDGTNYAYIVGTWYDYDRSKTKVTSSSEQFMGLLVGKQVSSPITEREEEMIRSKFKKGT